MIKLIDLFILLATFICVCGSLFVWWELRRLRAFLFRLKVNLENMMPPVKFFGSYRKSLIWIKNNRFKLPEQFKAPVERLLIVNKLVYFALGFLIVVAAFSIYLNG